METLSIQPRLSSPSSHSPEQSPTSSPSKSPTLSSRRANSPMAIDLSSLPPLSQPSPPSNTLIITQLNDPAIFHPASLATIRQHLISLAPLYSFSPLKSFARIICSFYDIDSAIRVRQNLDGAALLNETVRTRVYFGEPTPIGEATKFLDRPDAGRLFFISPPPSPPVGWEVREEGPPNKDVHASDLADALGKLTSKMDRANVDIAELSPVSERGERTTDKSLCHIPTSSLDGQSSVQTRSRSSTVIYDPEAHGDSPGLPAVILEDTTIEDDTNETQSAVESRGRSDILHTARPPIELMDTAE